jgi:hypothetical protein
MNWRDDMSFQRVNRGVLGTTAIAIVVAGLTPLFAATPAFASTPSGAGVIVPGQTLSDGETVTSGNGLFTLDMQTDGNLVLYVDPAIYGHAHPLWWSGTEGHPGAHAVMQSDGNLVVYLGSTPLWWSHTQGQGAYAYVQNDGNFVLYHNSTALWYTSTYGTTTSYTNCLSMETAFNAKYWQVCMSSNDWTRNGLVAGYLTGYSCGLYLPTAVGWSCDYNVTSPHETYGSYWSSSKNAWEDWMNYYLTFTFPSGDDGSVDEVQACAYTRTDISTAGKFRADNFYTYPVAMGTTC